jgi:hypothetical protein
MRRVLYTLCALSLIGCDAIFGIVIFDDDGGPGDADAAVETSMPDAAPFCASSNHYYCNDFDESTKVTYGFDQALTKPSPPPLAIDTTQFVSAPAALALDTPSTFQGGCNLLLKSFTTPTPFKTVTFAFELYVDTLNGTPITVLYVDPAAIGLTQTNPFMGLLLDPANDAILYSETAVDSTLYNHFLSSGTNTGIQLKVWYQVSLTIDVVKGTFDASATPTSGVTFSASGTSLDGGSSFQPTKTPYFEFGACAIGGSIPSTHVFFDNLTVDFTF